MIKAIVILFQVSFALSVAALILGLIRPVWVLWFMDRSNRLAVIKIYGGLAIAFLLLWRITSLFSA